MKTKAFGLILGTLLVAACGHATTRGVTTAQGALRAHAIDPLPMTETLSPNCNDRPENTQLSCIVLHHTAVAANASRTVRGWLIHVHSSSSSTASTPASCSSCRQPFSASDFPDASGRDGQRQYTALISPNCARPMWPASEPRTMQAE